MNVLSTYMSSIFSFFISLAIIVVASYIFFFLLFKMFHLFKSIFEFILDKILDIFGNSKTSTPHKPILNFPVSKASIKGNYGESQVSRTLSQLPTDTYHIINNIMLKTEKGTTQIDHVVVSKYGIFVIETKNYQGWIFGKEFDEQWIQQIYKRKSYFYNPIRQNYAHVKALEKTLHLPNNYFIPVVVFSSKSNLKINTNSIVITTNNLQNVILSHQEQRINPLDIQNIVTALSCSNIVSPEMNRQHVHNIHQRLFENEQKIRNNICPKCGGRLVQRNGKYGAFIGCANFPRCKFTTR